MTFVFQKRPYGPESTPEEIQAIKDSVRLCEPGIVSWRELPVQSIYHLNLMEEKLIELTRDLPRFDLLIDLVEADAPGPEIRERLKSLFSGQSKLGKTAVFTGKNFMLNVAAKFVLGGSVGLRNFSVHRTLEEALEELHHGPPK
jgi:hypothetical protein